MGVAGPVAMFVLLLKETSEKQLTRYGAIIECAIERCGYLGSCNIERPTLPRLHGNEIRKRAGWQAQPRAGSRTAEY